MIVTRWTRGGVKSSRKLAAGGPNREVERTETKRISVPNKLIFHPNSSYVLKLIFPASWRLTNSLFSSIKLAPGGSGERNGA